MYIYNCQKNIIYIYPIDIEDEYDELTCSDFDALFIQFDFVEFY